MTKRIVLLAGLLALGVVLLLRGLGVFGGGRRHDRPAGERRPVGPPDAAVTPTVDRVALARTVFVGWNPPGAAATIHAAAHPTFRASVKLDELQIFHDDFTAIMGPFIEVVGAMGAQRTTKDGVVEELVAGEALFGKGVAPYELVLIQEGGTLRLLNLKLEAPRALNPPPDPVAARTLARAAADALLAGDYPTFDAMSLPRIRGDRTPEDTTKLRALLTSLGGGVRLEIVKDEACGKIQHCVDYHAVGRRSSATLTLMVSAPLGRWRVNHWSFELDEPKPGQGVTP